MIFRRLISLTTFVLSLIFLLVGQQTSVAQSNSIDLKPLSSAPIVIAKKTKTASRASSAVLVKNIRFHKHKRYTRVVLDLPTRPLLKEFKNTKNTQATIELGKLGLSNLAAGRIKHRKFPKAIRITKGKGQTVNVILDLTVLKKYKLQTLTGPNRVVIDLYYSKKKKNVVAKKTTPPAIKKVKKPSRKAPEAVVKTPTKKASATKKPIQKTPVTITATKPAPKKKETAKGKSPAPQASKKQVTSDQNPTSPPTTIFTAKHVKDLVVVIDPGHGGRDPGAIGKKGTKEKHITLKIAQHLKDLIRKRLGSTVLLTRSKDNFLDLEKRVEFANKKKADIFISIHVNSHPQTKIKGLEVYHFGKASDPRALAVAARENGMKLEDNAPPWQFIIADKLNDQKIEQSQTFAWTTNKTLVKTLKTSYPVKDHGVKTAPFYVLRFTTMPSILAEVAFVSNPEEEKRLKTKSFQKHLAEGIYKGLRSYLKTAFPNLS